MLARRSRARLLRVGVSRPLVDGELADDPRRHALPGDLSDTRRVGVLKGRAVVVALRLPILCEVGERSGGESAHLSH